MKCRTQNGNVLFLILLAVVLFAALAYAVTSSMRGGGKDASSENAQVGAAAIMNFLADLSTFVQRAQLVDNVKDIEFSFGMDAGIGYQTGSGSYNGWNTNNNCTRAACRVFKPLNPDGIVAQRFEQYGDPLFSVSATNQVKYGHLMLSQLAIQNVGSPAPELLATIWGIKPSICNAINKSVGLNTNYTNMTRWASIGETYMTSRSLQLTMNNPPAFDSTNTFGDEATQFAGMKTFCAPMGNESGFPADTSNLGIYHVLIER